MVCPWKQEEVLPSDFLSVTAKKGGLRPGSGYDVCLYLVTREEAKVRLLRASRVYTGSNNMVQLFSKGVAWRHFQNLEGELLDAVEYVPLRHAHRGVWSHKFGKILFQAGSAVDSFFRVVLMEGGLFKNARPPPRRNLDMEDYRKKIEPVYRLSTAEVKASDGLFDYDTLAPFSTFSEGGSPSWWNAYNSYKHDRYSQPEYATLHHTVESLGGLFILNVLHKENQELLVESGVIKGPAGWGPKMMLVNLGKSAFGVTGPAHLYSAHSRLFSHQFRADNSSSVPSA